MLDNYKAPNFEHYILERNLEWGIDPEWKIESCVVGNDPLYGNGSWDLVSGPYTEYDLALLDVDKILDFYNIVR